MSFSYRSQRALLALCLSLGLAGSASASTFIRAGLEELAVSNQQIVVGRVIDAVSYWNDDKSFILTDVTLATDETIKGEAAGAVTLTLMGGTVGDTSSLIVGGAELVPGRSYLLFLAPNDLPGAPRVLSVRDHSQGVFEITAKDGQLRAVSQASRHALLPDGHGALEAPGGKEGFVLDALIDNLRQTLRRKAANEVR